MKKSPIAVFFTFVACLCIAAPLWALDLQQLQADIDAQGAKWKAGITSLSNLSPSELQGRVGLEFSTDGVAGPYYYGGYGALPTAFDWRTHGIVSPVKDQGNCGSCWAFATVGAFESIVAQEGLGILDFSEQFLVSYNLLNRGCSGGTMSKAAGFLERIGTIFEDCLPYRADDRKLPLPCRGWRAELSQTEQWYSVAQTVEDLKGAVYQSPVAVGFQVFEDFYSYSGGVYEYVSGELTGGHGVLIVGWDDAQACFIVKNSWGTGWGESGFFKIAYSQVYNAVNFGADAVLLEGVWADY